MICFPPESCEAIKLIYKQFMCGYKVQKINWSYFKDHLSSLDCAANFNHQETLVNLLLRSSLAKKYPLKTSYRHAFLKRLLSEFNDLEVTHCAFFDEYLTLPDPVSYRFLPESCYKHFQLSSNKFLTLRESPNIISNGTTGLSIWEGAIALSEWAFEHQNLFKGKNIIELGSGIGFTGLTLCLSDVCPQSYIFSDCHPDVLSQLHYNIKLNSPSENIDKLNGTLIKVLNLDWENPDYSEIDSGTKPDVVIAADVVYDDTLFLPLCNVLSHFVLLRTLAIIACTVRNQETQKKFLQVLSAANLTVIKQEDVKNHIFYCNSDSPVCIYTVINGLHGG